jgi:two-component system NtrC family sensor kinase
VDLPVDTLPSLRILIVDDDPALLGLLEEFLTMAGHTVETVSDGNEVLARVVASPFDVIISDMRMPAMHGRALYRALEAVHPHLARRMVFMTGDTRAEDTEQFLAEVGAPTVPKPFTFGGLIEALRAALDGSRVRNT